MADQVINGKTFRFEVSDYKGKKFLVGREMYTDEAGELVYGRNGVNLPINNDEQIEGATNFIRNLAQALAQELDIAVSDIVGEEGDDIDEDGDGDEDV